MIDDSFELPELREKIVEELLGIRFEPRQSSPLDGHQVEVDAVILKLKDVAPFQLFYLSAGLGHWEELSAAAYPEYVHQAEVFSLSTASPIRDQRIVRAGCEGSIDRGEYCQIVVKFEAGRIELKYDDEKEKTFFSHA